MTANTVAYRGASRISARTMRLFALIFPFFIAQLADAQAHTGWVNAKAGPQKYAIFSIVENKSQGVDLIIGTVQKHDSNPLFNQDKPWEPRLDNGYPNVVYEGGVWRLWYGDCVKGCGSQILLYANSTDGLVWDKPDLNLFDVGIVRSDLKKYGKKNNIIMKGGGIGVFHDIHEVNASRRFKAFGEGCFFGIGRNDTDCVEIQGTATSPDGLLWENAINVRWPSPQRYDCHNNIVWDAGRKVYLATTRDGFSGGSGRDIGIALSEPNEFSFSTKVAPKLVEEGTGSNQLYSQITIPYYNAFLGIVMVYDTKTSDGKVHCRLSWSPDALTWHWVDKGGLTGRDFIPLGTAPPPPSCKSWTNVTTAQGKVLNDCDAYRKGSTAPHTICSGSRQQVGEIDLASCRLACSASATCEVIQWQGLKENSFSASKPGQCFLIQDSCSDTQTYDSGKYKDFCMAIDRCKRTSDDRSTTRAPPPAVNPFDSHICFAAASPIKQSNGDVRVYYMGGNGPHSGNRNSSFALATLRPDGFAGMSGSGELRTVPVLVTGSTLLITADVTGSIRAGADDITGLHTSDCTPIQGSVTDSPVKFHSGKDFGALIGRNITLSIILDKAIVYTIGFSSSSSTI